MSNNLRYLFFIISIAISGKVYSNSLIKSTNTDTSYSIISTYSKLIKEYPFIKTADEFNIDSLTIEENIVYADVNGKELHSDLYYPKNRKGKIPSVILIHGGGWSSGNKEMNRSFAIHLANNGFFCFSAEYRLSGEAKYPGAIYDIKTAIRWLKTNSDKYNVDTSKVSLLGFSSGGQMVSLIGATNSTHKYENELYPEVTSNIQAVVNIDGILAFIHPESQEGIDKIGKLSSATKWFGASSNAIPEIWNEASALSFVNESFPPILFINSKYPRFHAGRNDLIKKLDSLNIYSEVHEFTDAPHSFWFFHPWYKPTLDYILQFLNNQFCHE